MRILRKASAYFAGLTYVIRHSFWPSVYLIMNHTGGGLHEQSLVPHRCVRHVAITVCGSNFPGVQGESIPWNWTIVGADDGAFAVQVYAVSISR